MSQFDLTGHEIRITTRLHSYYAYDAVVEKVATEDSYSHSNNPQAEYRLSQGYSVDIFLCLQYILNFTYVINPTVDIYDLSNSSKHDVDLYMASFALYEERVLHADPTFVTGYSRVVALVNHEFEDFSTDVLATTFSLKLIWATNIFLLIFVVTIGVLAKYEGISVMDAQVRGLALIFNQDGFKKLSKNNSSRIVLLFLSVFLMILSACFTGNMSSLSTINENKIKSVDDLLNSDFNILLELGAPNTTIRMMLKHMPHIANVQTLLSRIISSEQKHRYNNISSYIDLVKTSPTAYIMDLESTVAELEKDNECLPNTLGVLPIFDLQYPWTMFMKKKAPTKPAINYGILKLYESGTMERIRYNRLPRVRWCKNEHRMFQSIRFSQIQSAFICIFVGFCTSAVLLLYEYTMNYRIIKKQFDVWRTFNFVSRINNISIPTS